MMQNYNFMGAVDGDVVLRVCLVAVCALFILLSGFLLPTYLRGLQQADLDRIKKLGSLVTNTQAYAQAESMNASFKMREYLTPVAFATFIVVIFSIIGLFGASATIPPDYILGGAQNLAPISQANAQTPAAPAAPAPAPSQAPAVQAAPAADQTAAPASAPDPAASARAELAFMKGTLVMVIFAFFGAFIWSVQYILQRIMTRDVAPAEFYKISINILFAITLAVAIRHSISIAFAGDEQQSNMLMNAASTLLPGQTRWEAALPTIGFLVGLFPNFFHEWLVTKVRSKWFGEQPQQADPLRLSGIEGLSDFAIFRLSDLEIRNAQSLAFANPVSLYMRTRYGLAEAIDWVSQAQLMTLFKFDKVKRLRERNIRTIVDLVTRVRMGPASPAVGAIATDLNTTPDELLLLVSCVQTYPAYVRLQELRDALARAPTASQESQQLSDEEQELSRL